MKLPALSEEITRLRNQLVSDPVTQLKVNATKAASTLVIGCGNWHRHTICFEKLPEYQACLMEKRWVYFPVTRVRTRGEPSNCFPYSLSFSSHFIEIFDKQISLNRTNFRIRIT